VPLFAADVKFFDYFSDTLKSIFSSAQGFTFFSRLIFPVLAVIIVYRCLKSMLGGRTIPELWGHLKVEGYGRLPVKRWENTIGRSRSNDIVIDVLTVSKTHAVLTKDDYGKWTITNISENGSLSVNGHSERGVPLPLSNGSVLNIGGVSAEFELLAQRGGRRLNSDVVRILKPFRTVALLSFFQLLTAIELLVADISPAPIIICFGIMMMFTWGYYLLMRIMGKTGIEAELLAIFLSTLGLAVSAGASPAELYKQLAALALGVVLFLTLGWFLRDLKRAVSIQKYVLAGTIALLLINLIFGTITNGARNWIIIGGVSIQPSEFAKVAFVYVGTAAMNKLLTKKNLFYFIAFSGFCIGILALLGDFGTAAVFFVAFLVIAYMRSGDIATLSLICSAVVLGGVMAVKFKPYIANRFATWGHVWEVAHAGGFQQTRTMSAAASGGLFGVGAGNGWLSGIVAADTDLVFGVLCEEWGLIIALLCALSVAALAAFTVKSSATARSSFYVISACSAMSMLVFQTILNVLGSVDILPLTGVTFPFISNGGSSLVSTWGLLAFVKAVDNRKSASFASVPPKKFLPLIHPEEYYYREEEGDYDYDDYDESEYDEDEDDYSSYDDYDEEGNYDEDEDEEEDDDDYSDDDDEDDYSYDDDYEDDDYDNDDRFFR
jgi:cell division protein FtsW (lipid II flippase)